MADHAIAGQKPAPKAAGAAVVAPAAAGLATAPAVTKLGELSEMLNGSARVASLRALGSQLSSRAAALPMIQRAAAPPPNRTGLPDRLKDGMESLSGLSLDDVRVHRNSPKPAQLQAHAYAQGSDIHLAPGQEQHLPHELGHVVQQKQGRVRATMQLKGGVDINDDAGLEAEADAMGNIAISRLYDPTAREQLDDAPTTPSAPAQLKLVRFKPDAVTVVDQPLENLAQQFDASTMGAFDHVSDMIKTMAVPGTVFDLHQAFPHSSDATKVHFSKTMQGHNPALKSAITGYMIEDIVSANFAAVAGVTAQYRTQEGRPDFHITVPGHPVNRRAVIDITSSGQEGHIWGKGITRAAYDYIAECVYPSMTFPAYGLNFVLTPASQQTAVIIMLGKALDNAATQFGHVRDRIGLEMDNPFSPARARATALRNNMAHLRSSALTAGTIGAVDGEIAAMHLDMQDLGQRITIIAAKYGFPANTTPADWAVARQAEIAQLAHAPAAAPPLAPGAAAPAPAQSMMPSWTSMGLGALTIAVLTAAYLFA